MDYQIELTSHKLAQQTLYLPYHYLSDQSRTHRPAQLTYGLIHDGRLVGACAFAGFPVAELFKGIFGIEDFRNYDQSGFHELSRLCIHPAQCGKACRATSGAERHQARRTGIKT